MKNHITFITGNKNKLAEAQHILEDYQLTGVDIDLPEIQSMDAREVITDKITRAYEVHGKACIVEDVSVFCSAIGDLPGPFIKYFLSELGSDGFADMISKYDDHSARFVCSVGYADDEGNISIFDGEVSGTVVAPRSQSSGFGFDPIFQPDGHDKTYVEMGEEKHTLSGRYFALTKLRNHLA